MKERSETMYYTEFDTDLCPILLIGDEEGITRLHMIVEDDRRGLELREDLEVNDVMFQEAKAQIIEYLAGKRTSFNLKLNPQGTDFQKKVWQALCDIPYGETRSYKDIAISLGKPKAARAIGMANNKNPIPLIIPCHRVVGANGKLTGYAFGLDIKARILSLETKNM